MGAAVYAGGTLVWCKSRMVRPSNAKHTRSELCQLRCKWDAATTLISLKDDATPTDAAPTPAVLITNLGLRAREFPHSFLKVEKYLLQ